MTTMHEHVWNGRRVLITDSCGLLGANVLCALAKQGACGVAHAREEGQRPRLRTARSVDCEWCYGDLSQIDAVRRVFRTARPDIVFHLAGYARGGRQLECVLPSLHGDLVSTVNVLTVATEVGCERVVVTGSLEEPIADKSELDPVSPYAAAKTSGVAYARMFHQQYGTPVTVARVFMTYGPGQHVDKVLPATICAFCQQRRPQLSSGLREVDWIYVDDVVEALLLSAICPSLVGKTLELGTGRLFTIREVVERVARLMNCDIEPEWGIRSDPRRETIRAAAVDETAKLLRWRTVTSLDDGLKQTIEWYRRDFDPAFPPSRRESASN